MESGGGNPQWGVIEELLEGERWRISSMGCDAGNLLGE